VKRPDFAQVTAILLGAAFGVGLGALALLAIRAA
jgi:hypothetical protein